MKNYLIVEFDSLTDDREKLDIKMGILVKQLRIQERGMAGNRVYLL